MLVPERRDRDGLAYDLNVRDNISLPALRRRGRAWFVSRRWQHEECEQAVRRLDIRPAAPAQLLVKQLSGGNQQKVLLAKWFTMKPAVLVLHEPTQAVDVGARRDILDALRDVATSGVTVIIASSQPDDLVAVCDRVLIHRPGGGVFEAESSSADVLIDHIYATQSTLGQGTLGQGTVGRTRE
jgi:ribose transport system ATP-binding protein